MSLLILNAGSSTLKFVLFETPSLEERGDGVINWKKSPDQATVSYHLGSGENITQQAAIADYGAAVRYVIHLLADTLHDDPITACGHRIVHGGPHLRASV